MTRGMETLTQAQHKAAEALYKQSSAAERRERAGGPAAGRRRGAEPAGGAKPDGDVIDAEVVDEEKK